MPTLDETELDVRPLDKPDKHPTIFATYRDLAVGESFVLVNNHDPRHLRDEFEAEHPRSYGWEYVEKGPKVWRIRITKQATTPLPRVLVDTTDLPETPGAAGAAWKLEVRQRDLDANVIQLPPGGTIDAHTGPDLDVILAVIGGSGALTTELDTIDLAPGALVWLPRRSRREFTAGPDGLRYFSVHQRRKALVIDTTIR